MLSLSFSCCPIFSLPLVLFLMSVTHTQSKVCVMDLKGAATSQSLYLHGGDTLTALVESLLPPVTTWLPKPPGIITSTAPDPLHCVTPQCKVNLMVSVLKWTQPSRRGVHIAFFLFFCISGPFFILQNWRLRRSQSLFW